MQNTNMITVPLPFDVIQELIASGKLMLVPNLGESPPLPEGFTHIPSNKRGNSARTTLKPRKTIVKVNDLPPNIRTAKRTTSRLEAQKLRVTSPISKKLCELANVGDTVFIYPEELGKGNSTKKIHTYLVGLQRRWDESEKMRIKVESDVWDGKRHAVLVKRIK